MEYVRKFAPYLAVEVLLPGGTLIALAMYLIRNRKNISGRVSRWRSAVRLLGVTV